jgi:FtsP/CotA-like multicopper oxidase with cupredoxin domain
LVVEEREPPPVDQDLVLVLDDWALDDRAQVRASFGDPGEVGLSGRLGNWLTVDSREPPRRIEVPAGARLRVRVLNAANARPFTLLFEGLTVNVVAVDGQPSEVFAPARGAISLVPGSRLDLMVDAPATTGATGSIKVALGPGLPVLTVTTTSARSELGSRPVAPLPPNRLPKAIALEAAARAELVIEGGLDPAAIQGGARPTLSDPARAWTINRTAWPDAAAKPVLSVKAGRPVTLGLVNRTPFLQAMHIHGHHVRLLHNLDDGWEPYWLDTVPVPPGGTARIAFVAEAPGKWMVGSTILERLSGGLACWFEVT